MNLILHQLKKDIRHTRVLLALWLVFVVMRFALIDWNARPGDSAIQSALNSVEILTSFLNVLLILILVPIVIQQEPLVGTTAFWFTRPLSRLHLLGSKALFVLLLISLPLIIEGTVLLANGVTVRDVALAVPEVFVEQFGWIIIVAALAVLTPSFGRFVVVGAIVLVTQYLILFVQQLYQVFQIGTALMNEPFSLSQSRSLVSDLILISFGVGAVVVQYLTRRTVRSITLAMAGLVLSNVAVGFWPWNFLQPIIRVEHDSRFHSDGILTPGLWGTTTSETPELRGGAPQKEVNGWIVVAGVPKGYLVKIEQIDSTLKVPQGPSLALQPGMNVMPEVEIDPDAVEQALGGTPVLNLAENNNRQNERLFTIDAGTYDAYASTPLDYSARLQCTAYKYVLTAEMPLKQGATFARGSARETITNVLKQTDGVDVQIQRQSVKLLFALRADSDNAAAQYLDRQKVIYVLVNRKRNEAVVQKFDGPPNLFVLFQSHNILVHQALQISFAPERHPQWNMPFPNIDRAWLADAVLVRLELTPVEKLVRTFSVPKFRLDNNFDKAVVPRSSFVTDAQALDKIVLPANATPEQVRDYVMDILAASRREDVHGGPEATMLERVGPQNVGLLIDIADGTQNYYLIKAIGDLTQPGDKELVLRHLAVDHDLVNTVVAHGWQKEAEPTLMAGLSDYAGHYPELWASAIVSLKDPATYDALKTYFSNYSRRKLFLEFESLPGFDLAGTLDQAWKQSLAGGPWVRPDLLICGVEFNEPGALDVAADMLKNDPDSYDMRIARQVLKDYIPAVGENDEELLAWFKTNRANLSYDSVAKKFVLRSALPPIPPIPAPDAAATNAAPTTVH